MCMSMRGACPADPLYDLSHTAPMTDVAQNMRLVQAGNIAPRSTRPDDLLLKPEA